MALATQLKTTEAIFGMDAASRVLTDVVAPWIRDLGLLLEGVDTIRPHGAPTDWQPGAMLRLPYTSVICREGGLVCAQALMALADTAMVIACSAAWNGYRPMSSLDQTTHFLRPVNFDVVADARILRLGPTTSFGRATLYAASDRRPIGMVSSAYAML